MRSSESGEGKKWPSDDEFMNEQLLKRTTDVKWAIDHLLFEACHVADSAYSVGRALLNDDGLKIGSQEAKATSGKIGKYTKWELEAADIDYLNQNVTYLKAIIAGFETQLDIVLNLHKKKES
jgi:hypothetical protein